MWPWRNSGDKCGPWKKRIGEFREIFGHAFSRSLKGRSTSVSAKKSYKGLIGSRLIDYA